MQARFRRLRPAPKLARLPLTGGSGGPWFLTDSRLGARLYVTAGVKRWSLTKRPAGAQDGPAQVVVAGGSIAQLGQEQVDPGGELDRRRHLERLVLDPGAKAAPVDVDRQLRDRTTVQVPALGLSHRYALDEVVEQLDRLVALDKKRVAEDARVVNRQS